MYAEVTTEFNGKNDAVIANKTVIVPLAGRGIERFKANPLDSMIDRTQLSGAARGVGGPRPVKTRNG